MEGQKSGGVRLARVIGITIAAVFLFLGLLSNRAAWAAPGQDRAHATIPAMITGTVQLQGRPAPPDPSWVTRVNVIFYVAGTNTVSRTVNVTTTNAGVFTVTGVDQWTWDIRVKGLHTLANRKNGIVVMTNTLPIDFGTLYEGDADNNNVVNILDFSVLATAYGKSTGQPGYDARADFNNSGRVEIQDYSLLSTNYLMSGDRVVASAPPQSASEPPPPLDEPSSGSP